MRRRETVLSDGGEEATLRRLIGRLGRVISGYYLGIGGIASGAKVCDRIDSAIAQSPTFPRLLTSLIKRPGLSGT